MESQTKSEKSEDPHLCKARSKLIKKALPAAISMNQSKRMLNNKSYNQTFWLKKT